MPPSHQLGLARPGHVPSGSWRLLEPWFIPFALINGAAVGLTPILLPLVAVKHGAGQVGLAPLAALAALAATGSVPAIVPLAAFGGILFAWSFLSVASPGLTGELAPGHEGEAQGVLNASSGVAGFAGSVIGGAVAGQLGYPAALALGAGGVTVGLLIFVVKLLRRPW